MSIRFDINDPQTQKRIGTLVVALGFVLLLIIGAYFLFFNRDDVVVTEPETETQESLDEKRRQAMIDEINAQASGDKDIDIDTAKEVMGLKVVIPDIILERYLDGDIETLIQEMEDYLVEYDFYMDVTKAKCTRLVTMDYRREIAYVEFQLNDPARTILTLEYRDHDRYLFNFR